MGVEQALPQRRLDIRQMRDQRIEARALLGGIDARDGLARSRVCGEPVDRLRGQRDQPAFAQQGGRGRDVGLAVCEMLRADGQGQD
jgi:hypothetical protein